MENKYVPLDDIIELETKNQEKIFMLPFRTDSKFVCFLEEGTEDAFLFSEMNIEVADEVLPEYFLPDGTLMCQKGFVEYYGDEVLLYTGDTIMVTPTEEQMEEYRQQGEEFFKTNIRLTEEQVRDVIKSEVCVFVDYFSMCKVLEDGTRFRPMTYEEVEEEFFRE